MVLPVARALPGRGREGAHQGNPIIADIFALNPWTVLFGAYRDLIYYGRARTGPALAILLGVSAVMVLIAVYLFKRAEPSFAKVL